MRHRTPWKSAAFWAPAAGGFLVMALAFVGLVVSGHRAPTGVVRYVPRWPGEAPAIQEIDSRLVWIASIVALLMAMAGTVCYATKSSSLCSDPQDQRNWKRTTFICSCAAFAFAVMMSLYDSTRGSTAVWGLMEAFDTVGFMTIFFHAVDGLAAVPMVVLFMSAGLLAYLAQEASQQDNPEQLLLIIERMRVSLYLACTMLVCALVEVLLLYNFIATGTYSVSPGGTLHRGDVVGVGQSLSLGLGLGFSIFLACVYLPAAMSIRQSAIVIAHKRLPLATTETDRESWLRNQGLTLTPVRAAGRVGLLLAPLLTGIFGAPFLEFASKLLRP